MKVQRRHRGGLRARQSVDEAVKWRCHILLAAGFEVALAALVANDLRYDLHVVLQLLDRGCPPDLAVQILEPLPTEVRE